MSQVHVFTVEMTCEGCSNAVKRVLDKLGDQVTDVDINLNEKSVHVTSSLSSDEILEKLKKTGKEVKYIKSSDV
ncbi:Copper transport protein ATOX1 [Armadillidium nasatum]|uniref:Copper transport protein ATOX1 n=1 Tax=Armadillidium nasatum TaxID=96803 RepID=A0A5N5TM53_9CRUS|nr:Copper transport protein ATOX1 [Armadillidium nasatum]